MMPMFLANSQMANAVMAMKSICCTICIVSDCAAKVIKFCLRQKRFATDYTELHGLFNDSAFGRRVGPQITQMPQIIIFFSAKSAKSAGD